MDSNGQFVFATCQVGAETALKNEVLSRWPEFRFSYSRPGFVTFRVPSSHGLGEAANLQATFARSQGFCLGRINGTDGVEMARQAWQHLIELNPKHVHVYERDLKLPGDRGFEPGITPACEEAVRLLRQASDRSASFNRASRADELIADCILVQPGEWWVGHHRATTPATRQPGGNFQLQLPEHAVSRAYLKMQEALLWSQLPLRANDRCVEIGSSPGGACQALLDRGCEVIGIDPAEMHADVLAHDKFLHLRQKAAETRRRDLRGVRWLMADSNVAPNHTLDSVESMVEHNDVHIKGMLLTLKLIKWELAEDLAEYVARIRSWGFQYVRSRQLAHNRQEICVAAFRNRAVTRFGKQKSRQTKRRPKAKVRDQKS